MQATQIESMLIALGDDTIAAHSQRYFKTAVGEYGHGDRFLGIRMPVLRQLVKQQSSIALDELRLLLTSEYHEVRIFALLALVARYQVADAQGQQQVYQIYLDHTQYINNWDLVDCSTHLIVGAYLFDKDLAPLYQLAKSTSLWERRIAMIACLYFIRQQQLGPCFNVAEILLHDNEDLIHKAVGWMLREAGKRDLAAEEAFLAKHYRTMPRTMLRYAIEKLPQPRRQQYLQGIA